MRDKPSVNKQLTFKRGHTVGYYAHQLFPGGVDVSAITSNTEAAIEKTAELIALKTPVIYEAAVVFNKVLVIVDILCFSEGQYEAYEIKSSLRVSEIYLKDAYLQYYVLKNTLPQLQDLYLVTLNAAYKRVGDIEPRLLFKKRGVRNKAEENFPYIEFQLHAAEVTLETSAIPNIPIGRHCFKPYQCDFFSVCWKDTISEKSIFHLPLADRTTLLEWHSAGFKEIEQVPDEVIKKDALVKIKNAFVSGRPVINLEAINQFVQGIKLPVAAMDMEVWSPALPQLQNTSPFEQIPFLFSIYDGKTFDGFFSMEAEDERRHFAEALIRLSKPFSTILVYDRNLETSVINTLGKAYPDLANELAALRNKLADVFTVFLKMHYYHPDFKNNFSLKAVSAALLKDIQYSVINSGLEAMNYFEQYREAKNEIDREYLMGELINYCNTDTAATLGLLDFLKNLRASQT